MNIEDLPPDLPPSRDLWGDIEAQIHGREQVPRARPPRLWGVMAAAAVTLLASLGTAWWMQPPVAPVFVGDPLVTQVVEPDLEAWELDILRSNAELTAHLDAEEGAMDPALVAVLRENLAIMDVAIARVHAAIHDDPDNAQLVADLAFVYERKLDLLRRASEIAG